MDQKFLDLAKKELGEDATKREQSLALFRDWLKSHPFLSGARQEDVRLLQFLRKHKFSMDAAFKHCEKLVLCRKKFPHFFDMDSDTIDALFDTGLFCPLIGRDQHGRKIVLFRFARLDTKRFKPEDTMKAMTYGLMTLIEEEETQIAGISFIFDAEGVSRNHLLSPSCMLDLPFLIKVGSPVREKNYFLMNLNAFVQVPLEFIIQLIKKKVRDRIVVMKSCDELKDYVDVKMLPKEYGGTVPVAEMLREFQKLRDEKKDLVNRIFFNSGIDWSKVSQETLVFQDNSDTIGSFRKLEID